MRSAREDSQYTETGKQEPHGCGHWNGRREFVEWDVNCDREAPTGTRFERRVCTPVFVANIEHDFYANARGGSVWIWIQPKREVFKKNMVDAVNKNPKLLELLMKRNAAQLRYEELRKKKFAGGKIFVPD